MADDAVLKTVAGNPVLAAMATCRAMRYLKPDPVPDALVEAVLFAATRASSPGNSQGWRFVVVKDSEQRRRIGDVIRPMAAGLNALPAGLDPTERRTLEGARNIANAIGDAPVIVFVCGENIYPQGAPNESWMLSAGYAASQNLIVAARSLGLGTVFTTFQSRVEGEIRDILSIPDHVYLITTIPLGWPARPFGPVTRKPLAEVVRYNRW